MTQIKDKPKQPRLIKCKSSAAFLATVPVLIGYIPTNSVVFVIFDGNRAYRAIRYDLPPLNIPLHDSGMVSQTVSLLRKLGSITSVAIVIYTDENLAQTDSPERLLFARSLQQEIKRAKFRVLETALVGADGWKKVDEKAQQQNLRGLTEIEEAKEGFEARLTLTKPLKNIAEVGTIPEAEVETLHAIRTCLEKGKDIYAEPSSALQATRIITLTESLISSGTDLSKTNLSSELIQHLQTDIGWFVALTTIALGAPTAKKTLLAENYEELLGIVSSREKLYEVVRLFSLHRIPEEILRAAIDSFSSLFSLTPESHSSPVAALLSWCWWMSGMLTPAHLIIEKAAFGNGNDLSLQVLNKILAGGAPLWIFENSHGDVG